MWMVIGYLIPNAALCPFVGALSDLFGRKWVAVAGQVFLVVGPVVTSTANTMNIVIGKPLFSSTDRHRLPTNALEQVARSSPVLVPALTS